MIVKYTNEPAPIIDGLIMIDCWQPSVGQKKSYNNYYIGLLSKLLNFNFKCIVNAGYSVALNTNDSSIRTAFQTYYWPNSPYQNINIVQNLIKHCSGANRTSPIVQEALLDNNNTIMLLEVEDFVSHWQTVLECGVNNWLVVGQAWKNCVHNRPVGLDTMYQINANAYKNLNFYALVDGFKTEDGSVTTHQHFYKDNLPWAYVENFGYKLITRFSNHWSHGMDFYRELLREPKIALEFMRENRIAVTIHCSNDVAQFMPTSDETFDVTVIDEPKESWQFSWTKFTGAYQLNNSDSPKTLIMWVFDITESLDLALCMNYLNPRHSSFITKNKKVVIFETSRITSTDEIEDFVK